MTAFESDFHLIWFLLERGRWKPPPGRGDTLGASFPLLSDVLPPPSIHHVRYHFPSWVMELCAVQISHKKCVELKNYGQALSAAFENPSNHTNDDLGKVGRASGSEEEPSIRARSCPK